MVKKIAVIGSGIAGLSSACTLADKGHHVTIFEKNSGPGGRCRRLTDQGFAFDMGPSWYWMPNIFERFFNQFGKSTSDYFELVRLDPSYSVFWEDGTETPIPATEEAVCDLFESFEAGAADKLKKVLAESETKYRQGMEQFAYLPCLSLKELAKPILKSGLLRTNLVGSYKRYVERNFKHDKLKALLQFPVLFLGASPEKTPSLYSLMAYADISLGTWYPMGGMYKITEALSSLATELGVQFRFDEEISGVEMEGKKISRLIGKEQSEVFDAVVAGADYHHVEQNLLQPAWRSYTPKYWEKRKMSPSCLLFFIGVKKKVPGLKHHNLFFDAPLQEHLDYIYANGAPPEKPLFYLCCSSVTDPAAAPAGHENLFVLVPLPAGATDDHALFNNWYHQIIERIEKATGTSIFHDVVVKHQYAGAQFTTDYNAYKGNAYGLANTLFQTAHFRPRSRSKKVDNLFYAGQLTVPGPGLPPSLISGEIAANQINYHFTHGNL